MERVNITGKISSFIADNSKMALWKELESGNQKMATSMKGTTIET
jgi:hypothetical protein